MKKRTLILLLVLVALLAGTYYFVSRPDRKTTLNAAETNFAVTDTAAITRVFLSSKSGESNLLERQPNNTWLLDKKYQANQTMVNLLLETLNRMQVRRPVSRQARNTVIKTLAAQGTKVELYTKDGLLKTFYVGGNTSDEKGSHFLMEGAEEPYVLHIRGFDGYLSSRFAIPENDLRSRQIFASIPPTIQKLQVEYLDVPANSFTIKQENGNFVLENAPNADTAKVKRYLTQFRELHAEMLVEDAPQRFTDSLSLIKPRAVITLTDANPKNSNRLVIFPNPADPNRMVARYGEGGKQLATIQQHVFGNVLIRKSDLLKPEKSGE